MPIVFDAPKDRYGIGAAGSILANALMQKSMEELQNRRTLEAEQRLEQRDIRKRQEELAQNKLKGTSLGSALSVAYDESLPLMERLGALQKHAAETGDTQSIGPILKEILKGNKSEQESSSTYNALKAANVPGLPEQHVPGTPAATYRTLANVKVPQFESESDKLEAKRQAELADEIIRDYKAAETEDMRLNRQEVLIEKGNLSTPALVATLDSLGLPIGILQNPDTEEFRKIESDFSRDISKVFPGVIKNFEIETYLKTIPNLMNSPEGQKAVIRNRKLLNEPKRIYYKAYTEILKENGGKKPPNMDVQLIERTKDKIVEVGEKFRQGINDSLEKYAQKIQMVGPDGKNYAIPANKIEEAASQGFKIRGQQ